MMKKKKKNNNNKMVMMMLNEEEKFHKFLIHSKVILVMKVTQGVLRLSSCFDCNKIAKLRCVQPLFLIFLDKLFHSLSFFNSQTVPKSNQLRVRL